MRFFSGSISSGKTAPSLFLHKQLDVTHLHSFDGALPAICAIMWLRLLLL